MSSNIFLMNGETGKLKQFGKVELPETKIDTSIEWAINGVDPDWYNQQPQYYEYLFRTSPKNGAIIKSKNRYVYGQGWEIVKTGLDPIKDEIPLRSFLKKIQDLKVTRKIISDRTIFGGFAVEMVPNGDGKTFMPNYLPFKNVRVSKPEYDKDGKEKPTRFFYTKDWSKKASAKKNPDFVEMVPFDWNKNVKKDKATRYIVYFKDSDYDNEIYPMPEYMAGVPYIDADANVGCFVKNNVDNGFTAGLLVQFYDGVPDEDQQAEHQELWKKAKHGAKNAGDAVLAYNENDSKGITIDQINPNGQDDRYVNLNKQIREETFIAHTTSPLIVGLAGENGLSNNADEKRTAVEDFTESYVAPTQDIFNEFMNSVVDYNEIKGEVKLKRLPMLKPKVEVSKLFEVADRKELRNIYRDMGFVLDPKNDDTEPIKETLKELNLKFSKSESLLTWAFEQSGIEDEQLICFDKKPLIAKNTFEAREQSQAFHQAFASKIESAILKLVTGDPELTVKELAELLKDTPKNIGDIMKSMESEGLIENGQPTEKGKQEIEDNEIFVVYKYALRLDVPELKGETSREFCIKMMELSKTRSWTIDQIENIKNGTGLDVFESGGGWYTKPDTDIHLPYCRHFWEQRLVRKK